MFASVEAIVASAPIAFLIGVGVGFVLSNRYRIVKRNGKDTP